MFRSFMTACLLAACVASKQNYVCEEDRCVPSANGLSLVACEKACVPPPGLAYQCVGGMCMNATKGVSIGDCSKVCVAPPPGPMNIVELAQATPDLSTLVAALKAGGLVTTLSGDGPFTVFAPTNEAFAKLPAANLEHLLDPANKAELVDLLTYHVVSAALFSKQLKDGEKIQTVEGQDVTVAITHPKLFKTTVMIDSSTVTMADVAATNGVVHMIDTVLMPQKTQTIAELAAATPDLSTLVTALKAGDLVETLSSAGPFTVFAPSNEAFAKLPPLYLKLLLDPANLKTLQQVLTYHVVAGAAVFAKDLTNGEKIKTVEGEAVTVTITKAAVMVDNSTVTTADVVASNGVVHIVDTVLMPPDMPAPTTKSIVELTQSNPDLSTLVTALTAAGLVETLSDLDASFTVFAPSNEAFAALPAGVLANLLKPKNKAQLVQLLTYHVLPGQILTTSLAKGQLGGQNMRTVEDSLVNLFRACTDRKCGTASRIFINPIDPIGGQPGQPDTTCNGTTIRGCFESFVTSRDNKAANGVVQIVDAVLTVPDHLYFSKITNSGGKGEFCGEADAAPRMPKSLFEPKNALKLAEYAAITVKAFGQLPLKLGRCKDVGYTEEKMSSGKQQTSQVGGYDWAPVALMQGICKAKCHCDYGGGTKPNSCPDQPDPKAGTFCSLCGPKYSSNANVVVYLYVKPSEASSIGDALA